MDILIENETPELPFRSVTFPPRIHKQAAEKAEAGDG